MVCGVLWAQRPNTVGRVQPPRTRPKRLAIVTLLATSVGSFAQVPGQLDFAVYATGTGCGAVNISGNAFVDSFDSSQGTYAQTKQLNKGIVGLNGNISLSGQATVNGPIFATNTSVGSCTNGSPGITLSGKATATGGYFLISPAPSFPNPPPVTPGTKDYNLSSDTSLPPGSYGNIAVSGGKTLTFSPGTYNVNSIVLSGGATLTVNPSGPVTVNIAGNNNGSRAIDFTGGSVSNPSGVPRNFQLIYGGNLPTVLSGGSSAYALFYAPNSVVSISGGSDWFGAMTVKTLDVSGNVAIHYDRSLALPPTIVAAASPDANAAGWNNSNVSVTFTCSDPVLGVASCSPPVTVTTEGNQKVIGIAVNRAGFSASTPVTVKLDKTGPFISASASPPPNAAGWNNSNVTVTFTCSDATSGISVCPPPLVLQTEGLNRAVGGLAIDNAGNTTLTSIKISLDKTPPKVAITSPSAGSLISLSTPSIGVAGTDSDSLSGVAAVTCNGVPATLAGSKFTCTIPLNPGANSVPIRATDVAGNAGTSNLVLTYAPAPNVTISSPTNLSVTSMTPATVNGAVSDPGATVKINGIPAPQSAGGFSSPVPLVEGLNVLIAVATNASGVTGSASVQVTLDTTPPHITIDSPTNGTTITDSSVTVSGIANDVVVGTVNAQDVQVTVNNIPAQVSNRTYAAANVPLSLGTNTIQATGRDRAGNGTTTSITVTRVLPSQPPKPAIGQAVITNSLTIVSGNNQAGTIGTQLGSPIIVALGDMSNKPVPNQTVVFKITGNNGTLNAGGTVGPAVAVNTDSNGQARAFWTLGQRSGAGSNSLQVSSALAFGSVTLSATGVPSNASLIVADSGNNQTGIVGQPLPFPFVADVTDSGHNRVAGVSVTFTVKQGGGNFGGSTSQTLTSDSNGRAIAVLTLGMQEGVANNLVEATFPGNSAVPVAFQATTKAPGNPANTTISGLVLDNSNKPIQGATIRLFQTNQGNANNLPIQIGTPMQTNAQGMFLIQAAPVGFFKLMADGSTAAGPQGYPTLEYDIVTIAGNDNTVGMPIYLPALDSVNKLCVDATHGGTLTLPKSPGFSLTILAGSATFPGGARSGCISVTPVNGDKVPMAPGFGQQPRFIVTIQPVGTTFNPPAAITLPNVDGLKPKSVTEMYSYDHDLGMFVAIGTGTVSNDGSVIASSPGVGVLKAGWHCGGDPNANGTVADCPDCKLCLNNNCNNIDPAQDGQRGTSGTQCCSGGQGVPLQVASYTDLVAKCPNRMPNHINNDIDGCSVLGAQVGIPALNVQDPTFFLVCATSPLPFPLCGPKFNQANTAFGSNVGSVPEGTSQTLPCNRHDVCYQTCAKSDTQSSCDGAFQTDMDGVCLAAYPATCPYSGLAAVACPAFFVERAACYSSSSLYATGVGGFGGSAYQNRQTGYCQCCP